MKNKTAVEWFYDKIKSHFEHDGDLLETLTFTMAIAKQKEREKIINAYDSGTFYLKGENYYKKTFEDESGI